jgi:hypothetical protein
MTLAFSKGSLMESLTLASSNGAFDPKLIKRILTPNIFQPLATSYRVMSLDLNEFYPNPDGPANYTGSNIGV